MDKRCLASDETKDRLLLNALASMSYLQAQIITQTVIKNKRGETLLLRRNKTGGWFTLPGGTVNEGETINQALAREIFEETGLRIKIGRPLWIWQSNHIGKELIGIVFETKKIFPNNIKIKLSPEHNEYSWYSREKLFRDEAVDPYIKRGELNYEN